MHKKDVAEPHDAMTLRVERGPDVASQKRSHPWPALLFPLDMSVVSLEIADQRTERLDRATWAVIPRETRYRVRAVSPMTSLVTLSIGPLARRAACREYRGHVLADRFEQLLGEPRILSRTRWVDEIVQRYVFERDACEKHKSRASVFLETEITKEVYFLSKERAEQKTRASVGSEQGDVVAKARAWIDENLGAPLSVSDLAKRCHASESTLSRAFLRELGKSPGAYARERRLDSALSLLQADRYAVSEVATRVGYATLSAFTGAFTRRFGAPPSSVRNRRGALSILPPQGAVEK